MKKFILIVIIVIIFYIRFENHVHKAAFILSELVRKGIKILTLGSDDGVIIDFASIFV